MSKIRIALAAMTFTFFASSMWLYFAIPKFPPVDLNMSKPVTPIGIPSQLPLKAPENLLQTSLPTQFAYVKEVDSLLESLPSHVDLNIFNEDLFEYQKKSPDDFGKADGFIEKYRVLNTSQVLKEKLRRIDQSYSNRGCDFPYTLFSESWRVTADFILLLVAMSAMDTLGPNDGQAFLLLSKSLLCKKDMISFAMNFSGIISILDLRKELGTSHEGFQAWKSAIKKLPPPDGIIESYNQSISFNFWVNLYIGMSMFNPQGEELNKKYSRVFPGIIVEPWQPTEVLIIASRCTKAARLSLNGLSENVETACSRNLLKHEVLAAFHEESRFRLFKESLLRSGLYSKYISTTLFTSPKAFSEGVWEDLRHYSSAIDYFR